MRFARSAMRTGLPMSKTYISPPLPIVPASMTSLQASGISMKKRMMSGCVTVTGPPFLICSWKIGITEPLEPSTLPKRVVTKRVSPFTFPSLMALSSACTYISQMRFEHPITLVGFTALSVDTITNLRVPYSTARSAMTLVPFTLFTTASYGLSSIMGTCLYAAAWKTYSGRYVRNMRSITVRSAMSATIVSAFTSGHCARIIRRMSCIGVSAWSTSIMCLGLYVAICRTISEPMDPAAPVMSTVLPSSSSAAAFMSTSIFSRGSRSSTSTGWSSAARRSDFPSHSLALGITIILIPASTSESTISGSSWRVFIIRGETMRALAPARRIVWARSWSKRCTCTPMRYRAARSSSAVTKPATL